ncbi:MAG: M67 family metallopeptidase [Bryobacteraceae bacterium]
MVRIEPEAWRRMVEHACRTYPEEACGAMLGVRDGDVTRVLEAIALTNVWPGSRRTRYRVDPAELLGVEREARLRGCEVLGVYHSHPDEDAYFSRTDLELACPWYCYVVLAIRAGALAGAGCWQPDDQLRSADPQPLQVPSVVTENTVCRKS